VKRALVTCGPRFTTARMLDDYLERVWATAAPVAAGGRAG
jgi:hypothetical protein